VDSLVKMLTDQYELQRRLGYEYEMMIDVERIAAVKDMYIAAVQELGEALDEVSWKPWTNGLPRFMVLPFLTELNDAFQFMMNMWFIAMPNATPEQIATAMLATHEAKIAVNHARVTDGYDGVSTKCRTCKRAREDAQVNVGTHGWTCSCGTVNPHVKTS
jgi:dUTPase-like protein